MDQGEAHNRRLDRIRGFRNPQPRDMTLGFLDKQFQKQVAKPFKQLAAVTDQWRSLVPAALRDHTKLESLSRGVLRVAVDSAPAMYELDRMLRTGLQKKLIDACTTASLRRVHLRIGPVDTRHDARDSDNDDSLADR